MGILRVGFKDLIRNKRKSIILILGVLISIILFSGINISTLSLTIYNIKTSLSDIYVDIDVEADSVDIDGIVETLNKVKDYDPIIEHIIPSYSRYFFCDLILTKNDTINWDKIIEDKYKISYFQYIASILGVNNSFYSLDRFKSTYELLLGRLPLNPREILLDYDTFSSLNLNINDTITLGTYLLETYGYPENVIFTVSDLKVVGAIKINHILDENDRLVLESFFPHIHPTREGVVILTNFDFALELHENLSLSNDPYNRLKNRISYNFLIDHYSLDILNYEGIIDRIYRIKNRIYIEDDSDYFFQVNSDLIQHLVSTRNDMAFYQLSLLMVSFSVFILSFFLSMTLYTISLNKQEIKFGQFSSKGASKRQIILWIIIQTTIYGIIGGLIGVLGGYFTSYFILFSLLGNEFIPLLQGVGILINPFTIIFSVVIGVIFSLISLIKPLKDFSKKSIITTTKKFSQLKVEEKPFRSKVDWLILSFGIKPLVSFSRKIIKPFAKNKYKLIVRNLTRNTRRTFALVCIISFTFCFAILSAVISESQKDFEYELTYLNIGSDIKACGSYRSFSPDLDKNITNMSSNINNTTLLVKFSGNSEFIKTDYGSYSYEIKVHAVHPENYVKVSQFKDKYFSIESNVNTILELSTMKNGTLVQKDFALKYGLNIGDTLKVLIFQPREPSEDTYKELNFKIIGFFYVLPGIEYGNEILVNYEYINETYGLEDIQYFSVYYLIDVKDDVNISKSQIAQDIEEKFDEQISSTKVLEEILAKPLSIIKLLDTDYFFIMVIGIFGLIILLYENFSDRKVELGILRARGIEKNELVKINLIEGIIYITYGFLIGCFGFLGAFVILRLLDVSYYAAYAYFFFPHSYIIPLSMFWQMGIAILIMIISVWITSIIEVKKTDIPKLSKLLKI